MTHEIYDKNTEAADKKIYFEGIQGKLKEIINGVNKFESTENWVFSQHPSIKERLTGIRDLSEILSRELNEEQSLKDIIISECDLDHRLGNFTYNIRSIERLNQNQFNNEIDGLLRVLKYKSDETFGFLSKVTSDPDYLKYVLSNPFYFEKAA